MKLQTAKNILRYAKQYIDLGQLRVAQTDEDWVYLNHEHVIGVALNETPDEIEWNKWMIGYIKDTFDYDVALEHMEIFSLLHELGHHVNGDICTDEEYSLLVQELDDNAKRFDIEVKEKDNTINVRLVNNDEVISYDVKKITIDKKTNEYEYEVVGKSTLAFDHDEIIIKGIMDLRRKVESTDIVFNLMPEEFTIGELKQVYSLLLGRELVNSAFRRIIAPKIIDTGKMIRTGGHRPSSVCRYNEEHE